MGAADAPVIMGVSPWKTKYQLWLEKTAETCSDNKSGNWATQRGHDLEPRARAQYELETGITAPATLAEHATYPFLRASLDGYSVESKLVLEIKCPGKDDHELALKNQVPDKYYPQIQHQLLVTGAEMAHYYSFDGTKGVLVRVPPDREYCTHLLAELLSFWNLVETKTPPAYSDKDYKRVRNGELNQLMRDWKSAKELSDKWKDVADKLQKQILASDLIDHPRILIEGVKISKVQRKGAVDYKVIPNLEGVDLEKYRKKSSSYYVFKQGESDDDD